MIDMQVEEQATPKQENPLVAIVAQSGLEQTKAQFILEKFTDYFRIASYWETKAKALVVTSAEQTTEMKMAREGRLFLKGKRVEIERARKDLKEQSLREGKAIDGISNVLKGLIEPIESFLEEQERFVELREERRKSELRASRQTELVALGMAPELYDLANMPEAAYAALLMGRKEELRREEEARQKAEEERIAREAEEKRIREENERLKREREEHERVLAAERAKAEAEQCRIREESEKAAAKQRQEAAERERKLKAEQQQQLAAERKERERIEAELRAKKEAEEKERKQREADERKAARAPDKTKLLAFATMLCSIERPQLKSEEAKKILADAVSQVDRACRHIRQMAEEL